MFTTLSAALMLSAAPLALAQTDTQPLKGPEVTDHSKTTGKSKSPFGGDAAGKNKARPQMTPPMPVFMKALSAANLTEDQSTKSKALAADFEKSVTAFLDKHKTEIDASRAKLSEQDREALDKMLASGRPLRTGKTGFKGKGKNGPADDSMTTKASPEAADARAKLLEIYSQRPKPEETQTKILALLNEKQNTAFETELKQMIESHRGKGHGDGKGGAKGTGAAKGGGKS